jgi:hypothetical protein
MDDMYKRPDRAEIAARVEAQLRAERGAAREPAEAAPPAARCEACGYLVTAPGHAIACA